MNLKHIKYIIAIANLGNLTKAAASLGISQPALSKYLANLECYTGCELFYKVKGRLEPTRAGRIYISAAYQITAVMEETKSAVNALQTSHKRYLKIGVTPHQGIQVAAKLYPRFRNRFPDTEFSVYEGYTSQLYEALRRKSTDYILTTVLDCEDDIEIYPLFDEELLLSVPAFHNISTFSGTDIDNFGTIDLSEVMDIPFILMDDTTSIGRLSRKILGENGLSPMISFCSTNGYAVDAMIRSGNGVGFIPQHYAVYDSDVMYFHLKNKVYFSYCFAIRRGYCLSERERYLTYLQIKEAQTNKYIKFCYGELVRSLVEEFESKKTLDISYDWRD